MSIVLGGETEQLQALSGCEAQVSLQATFIGAMLRQLVAIAVTAEMWLVAGECQGDCDVSSLAQLRLKGEVNRSAAACPAVSDTLTYPDELPEGCMLVSKNGKFALKMQSDGNLVQQWKHADGSFSSGGCFQTGLHYDDQGKPMEWSAPFRLGWMKVNNEGPFSARIGAPAMGSAKEKEYGRIHPIPADGLTVQSNGDVVWTLGGNKATETCSHYNRCCKWGADM